MSQVFVASLFDIEVKTLVVVLFWGNLASVLLVFAFYQSNPELRDKVLSTYCALAKLFQALAFFLIFFRGVLPDSLSLNAGNSFLLIGFFWEGLVILAIAHKENGRCRLVMACVACLSLVIFNVAEFINPESPSFRVAVASVCVFLVLLFPIGLLTLSRVLSAFQRAVSLFYIVFSIMLIPRTVVAVFYPIGILSNSLIQALTFLSLVFIMLFSLSAYLLVEKERAERAILTMARTDALTGLPNRCSFMFDAERMFDAHKEGHSQLAVLFVDIDDFKQINDTYGHVFGDEVLKRFGDILARGLRVVDLRCRFGARNSWRCCPARTMPQPTAPPAVCWSRAPRRSSNSTRNSDSPSV